MLQYLIVLLDRTSVSYCHYQNSVKENGLISLEDLKAGIFYAMKENLMLQFVYPDYELPAEYKAAINTIDHSDIVSCRCEDAELRENAEVVVFDCWDDLSAYSFKDSMVIVVRSSKKEFFENYAMLEKTLAMTSRVNVVLTDIDSFKKDDFDTYKNVLDKLVAYMEKFYAEDKFPQLNLLTDRLMLDKMNNCNAGIENVTLAPDGKFYICPAFYLEDVDAEFGLGKARFNIGSLQDGLDIKNRQLYALDHAPICRNCDAYQCRRCVWMNRKATYEVNTPGHEQCVVAHLERNASRELLAGIRKKGSFFTGKEIKEIDYLDPIDIINEK